MRVRRIFFVVAAVFLDVLSCFPQEDELVFGIPDGACADIKNTANFLIQKKQYALSYNSEKLIPNWVAWYLSAADFGDSGRGNDFRSDSDLPEVFYAVKKSDYQYKKYGFDRGHVCPSADRTSSKEDNSATFLMTNMIPQAPDCNRIVWKELEAFERNLAIEGKKLFITAGPCGTGGTGSSGYFESLPVSVAGGGKKSINVPSLCWKIIIILPEQEEFQADSLVSGITSQTQVIAVCMPNSQGVQISCSWKKYITNIDYIEEITGYDFFSELPDEIENELELKVYSGCTDGSSEE